MALFDDAGTITSLVRPAQTNHTGAIDGNIIAEYGGMVEGTIERLSVLSGWVPVRSIRGTNTIQNFAVGQSTLRKVVPGVAVEGDVTDFGKATLKVDTLINARATVPLLEDFTTQYDARAEIGREHGKIHAKFKDQAFFIQAYKAAVATASKYAAGIANAPAGHGIGQTVTLTATGDALDPAKLYQAVSDLAVKFELQDVSPAGEDMILAFRPAQYYALQQAEQIINGDYKTSEGTVMRGIAIYKALGVPVVSTNNLPSTVVTGHFLSNADNGAAYDGDFTKLAGLMFSPRALLAGEIIPLTSDVFYDKFYKTWCIDSHTSFGVTTNRHEYSGAILLP